MNIPKNLFPIAASSVAMLSLGAFVSTGGGGGRRAKQSCCCHGGTEACVHRDGASCCTSCGDRAR